MKVPLTMTEVLEGIDDEVRVIITRTGKPEKNASDSNIEKAFDLQVKGYNKRRHRRSKGSYIKFWNLFSEKLMEDSVILDFKDEVTKKKRRSNNSNSSITTTTTATSSNSNKSQTPQSSQCLWQRTLLVTVSRIEGIEEGQVVELSPWTLS
ncbi:uncharacterized protein J8A68_006156 [[Candida] subhashii]|uniref:Uncharacterized protein n=1 Tax=[Candida] subhashii TaxID=561895 RepID=A0A8J5UU06_9ASCO|nr:uncharacterized protein J8A68_006156 [[Candida] subhashii]KAG7660334.1 hypothetical protein J8A68_006156 [[Candida] subhashii]